MIPASVNLVENEEALDNYEIPPTRTYKIDFENKRMIGHVEGPDAVVQFVQKVLSTPKYAYEIYDWYYGHELEKVARQDYEYAVARIPNILREALLVDSRITRVTDFEFQKTSLDSILVSCSIGTIYGDIQYEQEVLK